MWNTYGDGTANPYDNEDCFRTLPLTDRRPAGPDLAETMVVDLRRISPDLAETMLVNRPPVTFDSGNRFAPAPAPRPAAQGYAYNSNRRDVRHTDRAADSHRIEETYDNPVHFSGPGGPGGFYGDSGDDSAPRRRSPSRRIVFTVGGLTLLGGLGVAAARSIGVGNSTRLPAAAAPPRPAGLAPSASSHPSAAPTSSIPTSSTPTSVPTHPATPVPTGTATTGPNTSTQVQTAPEYYVHNGPKGIALTLDDGPTSEYTPQILALLQKYGITATFCMIGQQIPPNAALVREVAAAGHAIVNHTWDHADQTKLNITQVRDSMARTSEALNDVGVTPAIYRAPYGSWNTNVFQACADAGLRPLDWSVDPQDWARPGSSTIVQRILKQTSTGSIILEHDGGGDRSQTVAALEVVLPELLNAGYRFGPV